MAYLVISIAAALTTSIMVYGASASILLTFLAYVMTGTLVLCAALATEAVFPSTED